MPAVYLNLPLHRNHHRNTQTPHLHEPSASLPPRHTLVGKHIELDGAVTGLQQPRPPRRLPAQVTGPLRVDLGVLAPQVGVELVHLVGGEEDVRPPQLVDLGRQTPGVD